MNPKTSKGNRGKKSTASSSIVEPNDESIPSGENENDDGSNNASSKRSHPSRGNALSARLIIARQFFLYGDGNGKRLLDPQQLADKVGCSIRSIHQHIGSWIEEHERMLINCSGMQWSVALSENTLAKYQRDVAWVEKETAAVQAEIDAYGESVAFLRDLLRKFDFEKGDAKVVVSAIQTFLQTTGSKKFLREHWMKVEKFWIEISGMASRISIAETFEKEIAKEAARRQGKGSGGEKPEKESTGGGGFFDF